MTVTLLVLAYLGLVAAAVLLTRWYFRWLRRRAGAIVSRLADDIRAGRVAGPWDGGAGPLPPVPPPNGFRRPPAAGQTLEPRVVSPGHRRRTGHS